MKSAAQYDQAQALRELVAHMNLPEAPLRWKPKGPNRTCGHCGSPAWRNPCFHPDKTPPCWIEAKREQADREHQEHMQAEAKRRALREEHLAWVQEHRRKQDRQDMAAGFALALIAAIAVFMAVHFGAL